MRVSTIQEIDGRLVLPVAPETENDAARMQDAVSHLLVSSTDTVTVNAALYGIRDPGSTHLHIRFTGAGTKTVVLADDVPNVVGLMITVYKSDASSEIVVQPSGSFTFRGSSSPVTVQGTLSEQRSFTLTCVGTDFDFVGLPRVDGAIVEAFLGDGAVTASKLAATALDGWAFGTSPEVPEPSAAAHAVPRSFAEGLIAVRRIVEVSGSRDITAADLGAELINGGSSDYTVTIPVEAALDVPVGSTFQLVQASEHRLVLAGAVGVTLSGVADPETYRAGDVLTATKVGSDLWFVKGDRSESGTYTPIVSNTSNFSASSAFGRWIRDGKIVSVYVYLGGTNTSASTPKTLEFTLPVPRILSGNFSSANEVAGAASWGTATTASIAAALVRSVSGAERAYINSADTDSSNSRGALAVFSYEL